MELEELECMRVLMVACDFSPQIVRALGDGAGPVPVGAGGANGLLYSGGHIGGGKFPLTIAHSVRI